MNPKEIIVVLNNTRKRLHSVHAENVNAINERARVAHMYPEISFLVCTLEEAVSNIENSARREAWEANYGE